MDFLLMVVDGFVVDRFLLMDFYGCFLLMDFDVFATLQTGTHRDLLTELR